MTNEVILARLKELTEGLYYLSESDYPLEVVHFNKESARKLSDEEARQLAGLSSDAEVRTVELPHFLRNMTKAAPEADGAARRNAERYQALQSFMEQHFSDVKVYRVGRREIIALALGALPEGCVAGFKTTLVET